MANIKAYYGITVTVTGAAQSLLTLLQAVDSTCPGHCRQLRIQSSKANTGKTLYVGDSHVATSGRAGIELAVGEHALYPGDLNAVNISEFYVIASDASTPTNVEILPL